MELRCPHKLHGVLTDGYLEVRCQSAFCGKRAGVVVIHRFDAITGKLLKTLRFSEPRQPDSAPITGRKY